MVLPAGKILLATDGSEDAGLASSAALDLWKATGSELHVVHVLESLPRYAYPGVTPEVYSVGRERQEQQGRELLDGEVERIREAGGSVTEAHLSRGHSSDEIIELAGELGASLIAVGSRGLGPVRRLIVGSVSERLVHDAPCPVLVLRGGPGAWPPERVVIGDDGSEAAREAGELAAGIGGLFNAAVLLIRAYPQLPEVDAEGREFDARTIDDELRHEQRALEDRAAEIEASHGLRPRVRIAAGDPTAELLEAAEEGPAERTLIAVGSRGLGAIRRIRLGSVSTKVLHAARGAVLVCPGSHRQGPPTV